MVSKLFSFTVYEIPILVKINTINQFMTGLFLPELGSSIAQLI